MIVLAVTTSFENFYISFQNMIFSVAARYDVQVTTCRLRRDNQIFMESLTKMFSFYGIFKVLVCIMDQIDHLQVAGKKKMENGEFSPIITWSNFHLQPVTPISPVAQKVAFTASLPHGKDECHHHHHHQQQQQIWSTMVFVVD